MRANTIMRLGSLALDVAQDAKVRELATIIHKGAKRRGLFANQTLPSVPAPAVTPAPTPAKPNGRIPFAPTPSVSPLPAPNLQKWLTADNAKKALSWAGIIKDVLLK